MAKIQTRKGVKGTTYRVDVTHQGSRITKSFKVKRDAERFAAQFVLDADSAHILTNHTLNTLTLTEAVSEYLERYTGRDPNMANRLSWWTERLGHKPLGKISRRDIKTCLDSLRYEGKAPATCNRRKMMLSAVFQFCNEEYDIKHNPCREIRQLPENNAIIRFLTESELAKLLEAVKKSEWERLYLLVITALTTGARRSELIKLRWSDIDFQTKTAYLAKTKNSERRVLPLTPPVIAELEKFREVGSGHLFPHASGQGPFIHFDYRWKSAKRDAGLDNFRFHDLRHSCASFLAMAGAGLLEIADALGHKSLNMTKRYAHLCVEHKTKLIDRVFSEVGG